MLKIEFTSRFKKDYKTMVKRGIDPKKLEKVLVLLSSEKPLPKSYKDTICFKNIYTLIPFIISPIGALIVSLAFTFFPVSDLFITTRCFP